MPGRILPLVVKEIQSLLRDRKARLVLVIPPLLQMLIFSFAATLEVKNVTLAVLNQDLGRQGQELVRRVAASPTFRELIPLASPAQFREVLDERRALLILSLPADFSRRLAAGRPAPVQVIVDGRRSNTGQIALGYLGRILAEFNQEQRPGSPAGSLAELRTRHWFNPNLDYQWFTVPSLVGILTTLIGLLVTTLSVARERELGTFDQLLVSPLTPLEILAGKALPALLIATLEGSAILAIAIFGFRVPFQGSLALLYLGMLVFLLAVVGVGLFISSLCRTQQQAILGAFLFMSPAMLLSGFSTPVENMPAWLQALTLANPLRHFLVIIKGVFLKAIPLTVVMESVWPLLLIALATLAAAGWLFKRRLE